MVVSSVVAAQTTPRQPEFDAASVKPNKSGSNLVDIGSIRGRTFSASNATLRDFIAEAYDVTPAQLVGGPRWLENDRFDILAKAPADVPDTQFPLMLRTLLSDRFKLEVHSETREKRTFVLVQPERGRLGPQLRRSTADCSQATSPAGRAEQPQVLGPNDTVPCQMRAFPGKLMGRGINMDRLAAALVPWVGRVTVLNHTALDGLYDVDLDWTPDRFPVASSPNAPSLLPADVNGPQLSTAIREQLGLKLDSVRDAVDVLVIDRAELPTPD